MSGIVRGLMFDASDELNLRWNGERDEITSVCPLLSLLLFLVRMDFEVWFRPVFGFVVPSLAQTKTEFCPVAISVADVNKNSWI